MRIRFLVLILPLAAAGCGHSDPGPVTLSVSCDNQLLLAGAASVQATATAGGTTLTYPDPVNAGHTGTMAVQPGHPCTTDQNPHPGRLSLGSLPPPL